MADDTEPTGQHGVDPTTVSVLDGVKFLGKVEAPENCLYKYRAENLVREGDFAVIMDQNDNFHQVVMKRGDFFQSPKGKFYHDKIIDKVEFGAKVFIP